MRFSELSSYLERLEKTASRNQMTEILAELMAKSPAKEVGKVCYLILGRLAPPYQSVEFNIAEKMMVRTLARAFDVDQEAVKNRYKELGDLGLVAEELRSKGYETVKEEAVTVSAVFETLFKIASDSGTGSQERKMKGLAGLLRELDVLSVRYLTRIPLGKLRVGFSDVTVIDALSWLLTGDKSLSPEIRKKYYINPDLGRLARVLSEFGVEGLDDIHLEVGRPVCPALSARLPSANKIVEKLGEFAVEPKMDGVRVQIHLNKNSKSNPSSTKSRRGREVQNSKLGNQKDLFEKEFEGLGVDPRIFVRIFSRELNDTTHMFPDIVKAAQKLSVDAVILDGEAVAYNPDTEEFIPFQETMRRRRKYQVTKKLKEVPLRVFVFDLLYLDGRSLLDEPFSKRRQLLKKLIKDDSDLVLTRQNVVDSLEELRELFDLYVSEGLEGVMCKRLDSVYQAGSRNYNWVKYKRITEGKGLPDTVDGLVMGYYAGRGQRAAFEAGSFLVGVFNPSKDRYETVAKVGTGLTDDQWREFGEKVKGLQAEKQPQQYQVEKALLCDVWLKPGLVVEIDADEITRSPVHTARRDPNVMKSEAAGGTGKSLRFPKLVRFRDKRPREVTTVEEILEMYKMQKK